ncbi:O-antigen polysaccharide polymerase Wzy [Paenibacillus albicereus]|uniref:O-antigen polysaccharide polymerase Wzy n=1 Tax=Paenibacillus albicereus TaxID=2726185 RepID=A0A6H2GUL3_9BACL|nr:O-antigen polymerase [Paenibacillus albicereus]QJC51114.1 O-antigen polysaccharide polymerase Wzy [Paenibacillus albicereus]
MTEKVKSGGRSSGLIAVVIFVSILSMLTAEAIAGSPLQSILILFVLLSLAVTIFGVTKGIMTRKFIDFMSPYILFPMMYLIIYAPGTNEVLNTNPELGSKLLTLVILGFVMFLLGAFMASSLFLKSPERGTLNDSRTNYKKVIKLFYVIGGMFMLLYWAKSGGPPILHSDLENSRVASLSGNGIPFHMSLLMSVAIWFLFIKTEKFTFKKSFIPLFMTILLLMSTGWRSTAVALIFVALAIYHYKRPISLGRLGGIGALIISLIAGLGLLRIRSSNSKFVLNDMMAQGDYFGAFIQYLYNYPVVFGKDILSAVISQLPNSAMPLQYGKTFFWNFQTMIPGNDAQPFDFILKVALRRGFDGGGLPPTLLGDLYINFSTAGIVLGMLILGFIWSMLHHLLLRNKSNILGLIAAITIYFLSVSIRGGIENVTLMTTWLCGSAVLIFALAYYPQNEKAKALVGKQKIEQLRLNRYGIKTQSLEQPLK